MFKQVIGYVIITLLCLVPICLVAIWVTGGIDRLLILLKTPSFWKLMFLVVGGVIGAFALIYVLSTIKSALGEAMCPKCEGKGREIKARQIPKTRHPQYGGAPGVYDARFEVTYKCQICGNTWTREETRVA